MVRLTNHDVQGNWSLKGVKWENLYEGAVIDKKTFEKLYAALWKLKDYEDAEVDPEQVQSLKDRNTAKSLDNSCTCDEKTHYKCPNCGEIIVTEYVDAYRFGRVTNFCENCGQRLKWEEES